jgi:hypothetical protein
VDEVRAMNSAGFDLVLVKPITPEALFAAIASIHPSTFDTNTAPDSLFGA